MQRVVSPVKRKSDSSVVQFGIDDASFDRTRKKNSYARLDPTDCRSHAATRAHEPFGMEHIQYTSSTMAVVLVCQESGLLAKTIQHPCLPCTDVIDWR
jgi:hypothetical protein